MAHGFRLMRDLGDAGLWVQTGKYNSTMFGSVLAHGALFLRVKMQIGVASTYQKQRPKILLLWEQNRKLVL